MIRTALQILVGTVFLVVAIGVCLAFALCMPPDPHVRPFLSHE